MAIQGFQEFHGYCGECKTRFKLYLPLSEEPTFLDLGLCPMHVDEILGLTMEIVEKQLQN